MLAAMPLFHGFGLGVCIHTMLSQGGRCILVPRFTAKSYAKLITKYKCNFIAGVPTLFEALLRLPSMEKADLSSLKGVFSGGDSLSIELKKKMDAFLAAHNSKIQVREGYGTTETVTACCLTPEYKAKEGSIGVPFPDTYIKIVRPDTDEELPYGEEGEILLAGPTVMKGYMNNPEETEKTLRTHEDGLTWVYTGDLGYMDEEGFGMGSFNISFLKLSPRETEEKLKIAKKIPFSETNKKLKEYPFPSSTESAKIKQLLLGLRECGLKNDALVDTFCELAAEHYRYNGDYGIFLYHGCYDVPTRTSDKEEQWESEEVYDFLVCAVGRLKGDYEMSEPDWGFLYPTFSGRSTDTEHIAVFRNGKHCSMDEFLT